MSKRKLKRQLHLAQVIMLGTAGTLAAEIFVLTGHAAGMAGPAAVLALLVGGLLSYTRGPELLRAGDNVSGRRRRDELCARGIWHRLSLFSGRFDGLPVQHVLCRAVGGGFCLFSPDLSSLHAHRAGCHRRDRPLCAAQHLGRHAGGQRPDRPGGHTAGGVCPFCRRGLYSSDGVSLASVCRGRDHFCRKGILDQPIGHLGDHCPGLQCLCGFRGHRGRRRRGERSEPHHPAGHPDQPDAVHADLCPGRHGDAGDRALAGIGRL